MENKKSAISEIIFMSGEQRRNINAFYDHLEELEKTMPSKNWEEFKKAFYGRKY